MSVMVQVLFPYLKTFFVVDEFFDYSIIGHSWSKNFCFAILTVEVSHWCLIIVFFSTATWAGSFVDHPCREPKKVHTIFYFLFVPHNPNPRTSVPNFGKKY